MKNTTAAYSPTTAGRRDAAFGARQEEIKPTGRGPRPPEGPVLGWLVCTKGLHKGRDYALTDATTRMGRGADAQIPLAEEAADAQAVIRHDSETGAFFFNDAAHALTAYERITVGSCAWVFVPYVATDISASLPPCKEACGHG